MIRTIFWPTDLSKNSLQAARHVVSLAKKVIRTSPVPVHLVNPYKPAWD